ncbi:hypothetical protein B0H14DRAFT_2183092, partial [Mycena olivaceomarginata]
ELDCRCGRRGEVQKEYLIQCTVCHAFSHVACQRNGRASAKKDKIKFRRDSCTPPSERLGIKRTESAVKRSGKGALARYGTYWYPVRLIIKQSDGWLVEWWRGNQFEQQNPPPVKVTEEDLCDELWANATARRQIRLGKWIHAGEMRSQEDQILEFRDQPYTDEIESALRPHLQTLE